MKKPRLILHIGLNKTGTSTIQHSMLVNEKRLRDAGFHLPDRLGRRDGGHHQVVTLLKDHGPEAFVSHIRKDNGSPITIVSAEKFLNVLRAPAFAARLSEALLPHFETSIILFLRRQDYLRESIFAERVKFFFNGTIEQYTSFLYDFESFASNLETVFGRANIKIALYRDDQRVDSWAKFCGILGIDPAEYPQSTGNINASLPRRKTMALSMMPKPSLQAAYVALDAIRDSDCIYDDGVRFLMSPDERQRFLRPYLVGNRQICDRYELEGSDFFCADTMPASDWHPPQPISPQEWADFATEIASEVAKRRRHKTAQKPPALETGNDPI